MTAVPDYKYFAFISYNSRDTAWGKRLQRKLENYRLPSTLCSEHGWARKPLKPVFFAPTDIQPGGLSAELQERLRASKYLIVICSPHSAQSEWVGREISYFYSLGRAEHIHFFIVDGTPHSGDKATECFNPVVDELGLPEILGANIHEKVYWWPWLNKERAYVQLISKLLGVEFDTIWNRHRRLLIEKSIAWLVGIIAVFTAIFYVWSVNKPIDVKVSLKETSPHNEALPPLRDAIVTLQLYNETKSDTLASVNDFASFSNIPARFVGKKVKIEFAAKDFYPLDTTVVLSKALQLNISRDTDVYGAVRFRVWNSQSERTVKGVAVKIDKYQAVSDAEGVVSIKIPLEEQRQTYSVEADVPLQTDTIYMPCGPNDVLAISDIRLRDN